MEILLLKYVLTFVLGMIAGVVALFIYFGRQVTKASRGD